MEKRRAVVIQSDTAGPVLLATNFHWMDAETEKAICREQAAKHPELYRDALQAADEMRKEPLNIPVYEKGRNNGKARTA